MPQRRLIYVVGAVIAAVLLFVVLRPAGDGGETGTQAAPTTPAGTTSAATTSTPSKPPAPKPLQIRITVRDGRPVGGIQRRTLRKGTRVVVVVRADVSDHVHLHGYDVMRDVAPGAPARLAFRAKLVGRFEVELEDLGLPIGELEVRP